MLELKDVKEALSDVGVSGVEFLRNEQLLASKFCYDLQMDSLDLQDFISKIENKTGTSLPHHARDGALTVKKFIKICNTCK